MGLRTDLLAAKALIATPDRWCKSPGAIWLPSGRYAFCAWWAAGQVPNSFETRAALAKALPWWWKIFRGGKRGALIWFNDRPKTTHQQIMALFDRAIEVAHD